MRRSLASLIIAACMVCAVQQLAYAREETARITGYVSDIWPSRLAGAVVMFVCNGDTSRTQTDNTGKYAIELKRPSIDVEENPNPEGFALHQNYPNPFNPSTTIEYELSGSETIHIDVYSSSGQRIKRLVNGIVDAGRHTVVWNGTDSDGRRVAAGVYLCRMKADGYDRTVKMTLVDGGGDSTVTVSASAKTAVSAASGDTYEYDITVTMDGYYPCHEQGYVVKFNGWSQSKSFVMTRSTTNPPVADAGPDQEVLVGTLFTLDGSGSRPGDGTNLKYKWEKCENNPDDIFILRLDVQPETGARIPGIYRYALLVDDGVGISAPDTIAITVKDKENRLFEDYGLELSIRYQLNIPDQDLNIEEIAGIDSLVSETWLGKLTSLKGVEYMPDLYWLNLSLNRLTDISPLASLKKLHYLLIDQNQTIVDISPLAGLKELRYLNISSNEINDISALAKLVNLEYLSASFNPIQDIRPLFGLTKLKSIYLSDANLSGSLSDNCFSNMQALSLLWLCACGITDISALKDLTNLSNLLLEYNSISDISALEHLPNLSAVYLYKNNISDISPLVRNPGIGEGDYITLSGNPLSDKSINVHIPALKARGVIVSY